jgi:hypothetical protein
VHDNGSRMMDSQWEAGLHTMETGPPKASYDKSHIEPVVQTTTPSTGKRRWLRPRNVIIGSLVFILVILAAVLGGVLGSRGSTSSSDESESNRNEGPDDPGATLQCPRMQLLHRQDGD